MHASPSLHFYSLLKTHRVSAAELFAQTEPFVSVPPDWHVVVTDVKGSTALVAAGHHHEINLVATGSVIAALNIAYAGMRWRWMVIGNR
jgi:hypothetical protein